LPGETRNGVPQYFQLIVEKRFGEAEKKLDEIKQTAGRSEQESGYLKALEGLLLTYRSSDDKYLYLNNVELSAKNSEALRKEFSEQASYPLFEDYDKGYFSSLSDYMKTVSRLRPWHNRKPKHEEQRPATEKSHEAQ
jgi:hypothetical protein